MSSASDTSSNELVHDIQSALPGVAEGCAHDSGTVSGIVEQWRKRTEESLRRMGAVRFPCEVGPVSHADDEFAYHRSVALTQQCDTRTRSRNTSSWVAVIRFQLSLYFVNAFPAVNCRSDPRHEPGIQGIPR